MLTGKAAVRRPRNALRAKDRKILYPNFRSATTAALAGEVPIRASRYACGAKNTHSTTNRSPLTGAVVRALVLPMVGVDPVDDEVMLVACAWT